LAVIGSDEPKVVKTPTTPKKRAQKKKAKDGRSTGAAYSWALARFMSGKRGVSDGSQKCRKRLGADPKLRDRIAAEYEASIAG
jgi:hypothetical protein